MQVDPPWSKDQLVVLTVLDAFGESREIKPSVYLDDEPIELQLPADGGSRLLIRTYDRALTGPDGSPARDCDIVVSTEHALPDPQQTWLSPVLDSDTETVSFSGDDAEYANNVPLGFGACIELDCSGYRAELVAAPPNIRTHRVVVVDKSLAYFAGRAPAEQMNDATIIGRIEGSQITILPAITGLRGKPDDMVWHPDGYLWMLSGETLRKFDRNFQLLPSARINRITSVLVGSDGTTFLIDKDGGIFSPSETSTSTWDRRSDFPAIADRMAVAGRDRIFLHGERGLWRFDGMTWSREYDVPFLENISAITADAELAVVVGEIENVRMRDELNRNWLLRLSRPFDNGLRLRAVKSVGGGRFIVTGDSGAVAVWTGSYWCSLGYTTPITLTDIAVSPDQRFAYLAADDDTGPDGETILVRVEIPAL